MFLLLTIMLKILSIWSFLNGYFSAPCDRAVFCLDDRFLLDSVGVSTTNTFFPLNFEGGLVAVVSTNYFLLLSVNNLEIVFSIISACSFNSFMYRLKPRPCWFQSLLGDSSMDRDIPWGHLREIFLNLSVNSFTNSLSSTSLQRVGMDTLVSYL